MAADATAAGVYQTLVKNADPLGAYSAGVALRTRLESINLAAQAQTFDVTLNMMKMQQQKAEMAQKAALATQELQIAAYNAETNRMNALRPTRTAAASPTGAGGVQPIFGTDEFGNPTISFGTPAQQPAQAPVQQPTDGQGDGTGAGAVAPLDPAAPAAPSLFPTGGAMQAGTAAGMAAPGMPGQPASQPSPAAAAPSGQPAPMPMSQPAPAGGTPGQLYVKGVNYNYKTGSFSVSASPERPPGPRVPPSPEAIVQAKEFWKRQGYQLEIDIDKDGGVNQTLKATPTLAGKSLGDMPLELQKETIPVMTQLVGIAQEKPAAQPGPEPGWFASLMGAKPEPGVSEEQARADRLQRGLETAKTIQSRFAQAFRGDLNYQPPSIRDIMLDAGFSNDELDQAAKAAQPSQQAQAPAPAGPASTAAPAPAAPAAAPANTQAEAQAEAQDLRTRIPTLNEAVNNARTPEERLQAGAALRDAKVRLEQLERQGATASAAPAPTDGKPGQQGLTYQNGQFRPAAAPAAGTPAPAPTPVAAPAPAGQSAAATNAAISERETQRARDEGTFGKGDTGNDAKWTGAKQSLLKALNDTNTPLARVDFLGPRLPTITGAVSSGMKEWFDKNKARINLKPMDNNPLSLDSPIFVDKWGRTIKLREIYHALLRDPSVQRAANNARGQSAAEKSLTDAERSLLR